MDIWDGVKSVVSGVAPVLANAIVPGSGGFAASMISKVLGCNEDPDSIESALAVATPEQKEALIKLQLDHKETLLELSIKNDQQYLVDRQDARSRDTELKKAGYKNTRADLMVLVAFVSFVLICWMININESIKPEVLAIFNMSVGALLKMLSDAFSFEFGSSRGSKEKDHV